MKPPVSKINFHIPKKGEFPFHFFGLELTEHEVDQIKVWCTANFKSLFQHANYHMTGDQYSFSLSVYDDDEAMLFKLTWS